MNPRQAEGAAIRRAGTAALAQALRDSRRDTLATFALHEASGLARALPASADHNPPLWELGHVGWFQERWTVRNPEHARGAAADPAAPRRPPLRAGADALYDSSQVAHALRASLPLPDGEGMRADLAAQLETTLHGLGEAAPDDAGLYFFRLALLHEDMHHEAALWLAQARGLPVADTRWQPVPLAGARTLLHLEPGPYRLGCAPDDGFAFDNELAAHDVALQAVGLDSRAVCWDEFLAFVEAGGYRDERWWHGAGRRWWQARRPAGPACLRRDGGTWWQWRWGRWQRLDGREAACHLNQHEARAWCAWAARRLPSEAEWEAAARAHPDAFDWGAVWEWTDSVFTPYPGFVPHPYRDYSAPWFGARAVLRGGSFGTQPRLHHARYRNFFEPSRQDVFAGFRSCAAQRPKR
jgi:ergothioneine biosynthesis protein EgtB